MMGELGIMAVLVGAMIWYLKYQTKRQATREDKQDEERIDKEKKRDVERKEDILFVRKLLTNDIKELHQDNTKNAELNKQSLVLQKDILKSQVQIVTLIGNVEGKINGKE